MLEDPKSPCRSILKKSSSFGNLLYDFLGTVIPMNRVRCLVEIGGGYGYLMRDFLKRNNKLRAAMIDLSPFLLDRQRENLREFDTRFIQADFFDMDDSFFQKFDLAILNEVIGDFPTACRIPRDALLEVFDPGNRLLTEVQRICRSYSIIPPVTEYFTLNLGGIHAVEKLCAARIPYIYISEHSCEAGVPLELKGLLELNPTGEPELIRLHGHDEYTTRFSDLEKAASFFGYTPRRGQYIDFIEPVIEGEVSFILCLGASKIDRYEIIDQFIEDLIKYEYLILSRST